ncbi:MAG: fructosamine kinase family protein [Mariprofundaceae bacterium]|nr:fructosamine kinase family protein [Mariprofundaceae bacterium]
MGWVYYADAEVELAFINLFSTFGTHFWEKYQEQHPIDPLFFETRQAIYQLYPLLVHTTLFSGHYVASLSKTLQNIGF